MRGRPTRRLASFPERAPVRLQRLAVSQLVRNLAPEALAAPTTSAWSEKVCKPVCRVDGRTLSNGAAYRAAGYRYATQVMLGKYRVECASCSAASKGSRGHGSAPAGGRLRPLSPRVRSHVNQADRRRASVAEDQVRLRSVTAPIRQRQHPPAIRHACADCFTGRVALASPTATRSWRSDRGHRRQAMPRTSPLRSCEPVGGADECDRRHTSPKPWSCGCAPRRPAAQAASDRRSCSARNLCAGREAADAPVRRRLHAARGQKRESLLLVSTPPPCSTPSGSTVESCRSAPEYGRTVVGLQQDTRA